MMSNGVTTYEVKPEYFYLESGSILFLDGKSLTEFLNYSTYKVDVTTYKTNTKDSSL